MPKRTLRERRNRLGLTAGIVAHRARLKPQHVYGAESGKSARWAIPAVRRVLIEAELLNRRWRHEATRIARKREIFAALPDCPAKEGLKALLLDTVWELLERGSTEEADMVLEIAPEIDAAKLLDEFFSEDSA